MKNKMIIILLPFIVLVVSCSHQRVLWKGGLWNIYNKKNEITAYGYVKIYLQCSGQADYPYMLKVEWIEKNRKLGERLYASTIIPQVSPFIIDDNLEFELSNIPGKVYITNSKNEGLMLSFYNPLWFKVYCTVEMP